MSRSRRQRRAEAIEKARSVRLARVTAYREELRRRAAAAGGAGTAGVGAGSPSGEGDGDGDGDGGDNNPPAQRPFTLYIYRGGVEYRMNHQSATQRTVVDLQHGGRWYRYRKDVGGFDAVVYMSTQSAGGCLLISNGFGDDDGGDEGYFDSIKISYDDGGITTLIAEDGGPNTNILLPQMAHPFVFSDWNFRAEFGRPNVGSWAGPQALAEMDDEITTVGPYDLYPTTDTQGNAGSGKEVGYFPHWMSAHANMLKLCQRRGEATIRRHRIHRLNASDGSPRYIDRTYTQTRVGFELGYSSGWQYDSNASPPMYRSLPTGGASYEETLGSWWSFDDQHNQRALYYWEVLVEHDPRAKDITERLLNDTRMGWTLEAKASDTGAGSGIPGYLSLDGLQTYMAVDPANRGAPGLGTGSAGNTPLCGRGFAHNLRVYIKYGTDEERQYLREFIGKYYRTDEVLCAPEKPGTMTWVAEGQDQQYRTNWPSTLGATATPVNPKMVQAREPQFIAINMMQLGGMEDQLRAYAKYIEPWPPVGYRIDDPAVGATVPHTGTISIAPNAAGVYLAPYYSLAFGYYHSVDDGVNKDGGGLVDAEAVYQYGKDAPFWENILSQCPESMWVDGVP